MPVILNARLSKIASLMHADSLLEPIAVAAGVAVLVLLAVVLGLIAAIAF